MEGTALKIEAYRIAYKIAENKTGPHNWRRINKALSLVGEDAAAKMNKIPLSNNIRGRVKEMSADIVIINLAIFLSPA